LKGARGFIREEQAKFFGLLLEHADPAVKENGLERLCAYYREGYRLRNPHPFRLRCNALLYSPILGVVRWALNTIALLGSPEENLGAVLDAISRNRSDQDVLGAGVAALVHLAPTDDVPALLKGVEIPFEGAALLAAAQQTNAFLDALSKQPVKPDKADGSLLRLATVLVGLGKAPENLFEPKYKNAEIVGILNTHHDALVAQYSIWAICENPNLGIEHLKINLQDISKFPPNIRGWTYQLIASTALVAEKEQDHLKFGAKDQAEKARLGLATGLKSSYFNGLAEISIDWLSNETAPQVKLAILEHMATNVAQCPQYGDIVKGEYLLHPRDSLPRVRMEAATAGTAFYSELRKLALDEEHGALFGKILNPGVEINVTQNFNSNNMAIGNVSGRDTNNSGSIEVNQKITEEAGKALDALLQLIQNNKEHEFEDGRVLIDEARKNPVKTTIGKVLDWMKALQGAANYAVTTSDLFGKLYQTLHGLALQLPI